MDAGDVAPHLADTGMVCQLARRILEPQVEELFMEVHESLLQVTIVEFDSYESAMENSRLPETGEFAQKLGALCDSPPTFRNLDVRRVEELG